MPDDKAILAALRDFADAVTVKMTQLSVGEPEDQLRAPFETLMENVGRIFGRRVVCTGEARLPGRMGKPDYAVNLERLLTGYVELKAPGTGADPSRFTGHNRRQWKRFQAIPNLLYCDGNDWGLYRDGEAIGSVVHLSGDVVTSGKSAVTAKDAEALIGLLTDYLSWRPIIPKNVKDLPNLLAPLCRMLRDDVTDALKYPQSPLVQLAQDWRQLLFPDASDEQFADAYAQTATFALLLARTEGAHPLSLDSAETTLAAEHSLLSRALQVLTDPNAQAEISASLNLLIRVIGEVPPTLMSQRDPWLYFYEDFLASYDPKLRKDAGVYYTPVEVVHAQVRLIDDLVTNRLSKTLGFADPDVVTLDPAVGTGTYLQGVVDHALGIVEAKQGPGAVPAQATALADNLYGFEIMVGPFAVSELRVSRALQDKGARLPSGGTHIYLTDTLENPHATPLQLPFYLKPIAEQHRRALEVKDKVPVIVCLGNPPYDRHEAADDSNKARTGGWVRWGNDSKGTAAILKDFLKPAIDAGHGIHVKNLYNLYVYFWRWALWKVFEHETATGPGVVSFISASSYLDGDAFCGMREHMRRLCDEIWILDLGGEGRGTHKSDNVFAIQTPVAIAITARYGGVNKDAPAKTHFARIEGTRDEKLRALNSTQSFASFQWEDCPDEWKAPFRPIGVGTYYDWPLLIDLFPWQHSGVQFKRTWPICPDPNTLKGRWRALLNSHDRAKAFKETRDRKVNRSYPALPPAPERKRPIAKLPQNSPFPSVQRYAYRSFDRQWVLADNRLGDFLRPDLWHAHGDSQVYLTSLLTNPLGEGPAVMACAAIPDLHHFSGRGGKDIVPLFRDAQGREANILPGLLRVLAEAYGQRVTPEDCLAYVYSTLAHPAFTQRYAQELEARHLRVPITKDPALFLRVRDVGARLLWLHTYSERFVSEDRRRGHVPQGKVRCVKPVPDGPANYPENYEYSDSTGALRVGDGEFAPVAPEVYDFEVSGLKVVQSWLKYRMKHGGGRKSSPLDDIRAERWTSDFTTELLELLWVLETTMEGYPEQAALLEAVIMEPCFRADEFPDIPDAARKPSPHTRGQDMFDELKRD